MLVGLVVGGSFIAVGVGRGMGWGFGRGRFTGRVVVGLTFGGGCCVGR